MLTGGISDEGLALVYPHCCLGHAFLFKGTRFCLCVWVGVCVCVYFLAKGCVFWHRAHGQALEAFSAEVFTCSVEFRTKGSHFR